MLDVFGAEKVLPYLITHPPKEVPDLFDRIPETQGDDSVDDDDIV
jgi:hypothetical protein